MSTIIRTPILDIESLLQPISDDAPVGQDLRYEDVYDMIKENRKEDDPNLPQGVWETELRVANWHEVQRICLDALTNQTKDLQIAAWLLESQVFLNGLQGVSEGLQLILELCKLYWENVHPEIEDDDPDFRLAPFIWLNEKVSDKLRSIEITRPMDDECPVFKFSDWDWILKQEKDTKSNKDVTPDEGLSRSLYQKSISLTPIDFYSSYDQDIKTILTCVQELDQFLDENCDDQSPGFGKFRKIIEEIQARIAVIIHEKNSIITEDVVEDGVPGATQNLSSILGSSGRSNLNDREEIFRVLSEMADHLMKIDPHSPVPFLIKRAVSWGHMNVTELLAELLKDGQSLKQVYSLLGIEA